VTLIQTSAFVALGSNLGDRLATLTSAINALRRCAQVELLAVSDFIETEPLGPPGQMAYLNAAAWLQTTLAPGDLMAELLTIEQLHGRIRLPDQRWGPRTLDLDLLLFGDHIINQPGLTLPHPEMHRREFVLTPLAQIAPDQLHPVFKQTVKVLLDSLRTTNPWEFPKVPVSS